MTSSPETNLQTNIDFFHFLSNIPGGLIRYQIGDQFMIDYINDNMLHKLGYSRAEFFEQTGGNLSNVIPTEDLKMISLQYNKPQFEMEHQIILSNGKLKWIHASCQISIDSLENKFVYCVVTDIQNIQKIQSELLKERERYSVILSLNSDCFFEYDLQNDSIVFTKNSEFSECSGRTISHVKEYLIKEKLIHKEDIHKCLQFLEANSNGEVEFRYIDFKGNQIWCMARGVVMQDCTTNTILGCIININKQKQENLRLQEQAKLDGLTRLFNKVNAEAEVEKFLQTEGKDGSHAFMIVDIDNFKRVNDQLGHLFGDAVLNNIAYALKTVYYATDIVGRVGGDEFVVFLKDIHNSTVLKEKASEVDRIFRDAYTGEGKDLKISCSMGISIYPDNGDTYRKLFRTADVALYEAKRKGKNSCEIYNENIAINLPENEEEYFNQYSLDPEQETDQYAFGKEISAFAFDILSKTKDVSSAVNLLIEKVGRQYEVGAVTILEQSKHTEELKIRYRWNEKSGFTEKKLDHIDYTILGKELNHYEKDGIYYIEDSDTVAMDSQVKVFLKQTGAKALLLCAFYEEGRFKGCVCLEDFEKTRFWTKDEADSLVTFTKIISFYLLKLKVSEQIQEKLEQIKNYDALTGLPTLIKFKEEATRIIKSNPEKQYAVIHSDIKNFKYMNDMFGYEFGDQILCDYAALLNEAIIEGGIAARVSSNNFVVLTTYRNAIGLKDCILYYNNRFHSQQKSKNVNCNVSIVTGIYLNPDVNDIMVSIDNANIARKMAKSSSVIGCQIYDTAMQNQIKHELDITNSMEMALVNQEFRVYLQPKINLYDNTLVGAEALVRWIRQDGTMLPPDSFIPLFEKNGFVLQLDFYIYEEVCKLMRYWLDEEMPVVPISVNVSRIHLNDEGFIQKVKRLVEKYSIPTNLLELELTESMFLNNTQIALSTLRELRALGFGVSIDDFGAGYSSLNLLKDMTTDVLKLDKEFFRQGDMQKEEQIIVSSIISMAKQLNMKVLSEGVETKMQSDFLKSISCDMAQGYLYAKPMPVAEFEKLMTENRIKEKDAS